MLWHVHVSPQSPMCPSKFRADEGKSTGRCITAKRVCTAYHFEYIDDQSANAPSTILRLNSLILRSPETDEETYDPATVRICCRDPGMGQWFHGFEGRCGCTTRFRCSILLASWRSEVQVLTFALQASLKKFSSLVLYQTV